MWERTLQDLVRGLRANKKDEAKFIAKAVDEIRHEIKTDDMELKAGAVLKLTYVRFFLLFFAKCPAWSTYSTPLARYAWLRYELGFFPCRGSNVVPKGAPQEHWISRSCAILRTGHWCSYADNKSTEKGSSWASCLTSCVFIPQDLSSNPADIAVTLDGLSHIVTPELSRDIAPELIAMLNHSRPNIRKRAILALYKTLVKYPEAINLARARLEEKLDDPDPCECNCSCLWSPYKIHSAAVTAATVNVLCELARRNPRDYLTLAPKLFHLLTSSTNNWMLIKIVKLVQIPLNCVLHVFWHFIVRFIVASWTSLGEETTATHYRSYLHDTRDFFIIRMCAYLHNRRNAARPLWRFPSKDVHLQISSFHTRCRPESYVSLLSCIFIHIIM